MSSTVAGKGLGNNSLYAATKAAIRNFARGWIVDLKDRRIRVNAISPGPIDTPGLAGGSPDASSADKAAAHMVAQIPLGRLGKPEDIANAAVFLASEQASYINGADIQIDGGWRRYDLCPTPSFPRLLRAPASRSPRPALPWTRRCNGSFFQEFTMSTISPHDGASRRSLLTGAAAAAGVSLAAARPADSKTRRPMGAGKSTADRLTTKDGASLYFKDWGAGPAVVFSHGYPLSSDAWEDQMFFLSQNGYRVIAHDRRGFGRSSQPAKGYDYDTFADDLAQLVDALDLRDAAFVGHSMGGGEVARYIGRHGQERAAKVAFISSVTPFLLKTASNPNGAPKEVFDGFRAAVQANRSQWNLDVTLPYYSFNRPGAKISEGLRQNYWRQGQATACWRPMRRLAPSRRRISGRISRKSPSPRWWYTAATIRSSRSRFRPS